MFGTRLLSSIVLMAITVLVVILGGNVLLATITIISIIGLTELYKALNIQKTSIAFVGYIASILFDVSLLFAFEGQAIRFIVIFFMIIMACYVFTFPKYNSEHISLIFFGLIYVTFMLSYIYRVRMLEDGMLMIWLIFIGAWGSDTCAYCVGMLIGKHRLPSNLQKLSPKKSIEGCVGGVFGAAFIGFIYATVFLDNIVGVKNPQIAFAIICACASILSQIGDLAASAIKRNHNIKDYGKLIPGHGGILDRFDSIIFTAPVVYFLANIL